MKMRKSHHKIGLVRERGAIGILGILTLLVAILFVAVAVDTGRLMLEQRQLQTVADMAALDASSVTGNCGTGDISEIQSLAIASANRNNHPGEGLDVSVGQVSVNANGVREFSESPIEASTAVMVAAQKTVPASLFAGGVFGNDAFLRAEAVSEREAIAGFSAGSVLASLSTEESALLNSLLGELLGSSVDLDLLSYEGIAATQLSLMELVNASATAGSVDELLNTNSSVAQWLNLFVDAFSASDVADVNVATGLAELAAASVKNVSVELGEVIAVSSDDPESAATANVNLLDLILTTAQVANTDNALTLPLVVNLPADVLNVGVQLNIVEPPQIAIGPPGRNEADEWRTQMQTSQIDLTANITSTVDLSILGLLGAEADIDLALLVELAQGNAWLESIQCHTVSDSQSLVRIGAQPGIADIRLTKTSDPDASAAVIDVSAVLLGLRLPVASVDVGLTLPLASPSSTQLEYQVNPYDQDDLPQSMRASTAVSGALANITNDLQLDVTLLGALTIPVGTLTNGLLGQVLLPVLNALVTNIIDPLLTLLGIEVGSMDVKLFTVDISRPEMQR